MRDMMSSSAASDAEHSNQSLDHLHLQHLRQRATAAGIVEPDDDVKDLSIRGQPQQAPVITSTAYLHRRHHHAIDNSVDFDSSASRSSSVHLDGASSDHSPSSPPEHHDDDHVHLHHHHHIDVSGSGDRIVADTVAIGTAADQQLRMVRMRKLSESACQHHHDNEHSNSYKFKNYIQQRFSQDTTTTTHDEMSTITDCGHNNTTKRSPSPIVVTEPAEASATSLPICKKPKLCIDFHEATNSFDEKTNGAGGGGTVSSEPSAFPIFSKPGRIVPNSHHGGVGVPPNPVPIFALHSQGRYYVPLTVDFNALVPYLSTGASELLASEKMAASTGGSTVILPPLHSININVNFSSASRLKTMISNVADATTMPTCQTKLKSDINGW